MARQTAEKAVLAKERHEKRHRRSGIPFSGLRISQTVARGHKYLADKGLPHSEAVAALVPVKPKSEEVSEVKAETQEVPITEEVPAV